MSTKHTNLIVSSAPHVNNPVDTKSIMRDVVIALCPALLVSIYVFGARALVLTAVCAAACVIFEGATRKLLGRPQTIGDWSAVVTGVILAFNLPVTLPLWMAIVGCFVAIVIVKQVFGGLGQNFANPAITGRIILLISFAGKMTDWATGYPDAISGATPLAAYGTEAQPAVMNLFLGNINGCLGETSKLALLIGFAYLLFRRVITWHTPVAFVGTVFVCMALLGQNPVYQVLSGGLMLGAIFMATDYATTPSNSKGRLIFGVGAGLLTVLIRVFGNYPEGVSFAILLMNIMTPHIENLTESKPLGGAKA